MRSRLALIFDARMQDSHDQYGPYLVRLAAGTSKSSKLLMQIVCCCVTLFFDGAEDESPIRTFSQNSSLIQPLPKARAG